ncbi:MAG: ispD [Haloplasmataceae bacterium]|jgi:2-C-methyl-D-erythritol 4-phosphate cytidylyltransferase|nr:ispD [Haloplasmataceae bacterium]
MNYSVIILAAGSGTRMNLGYNKMLLPIQKHPLITLTSKIFFQDKNCTQIIFVTNKNEVTTIKEILKKAELIDERCLFTLGGSERQFSVYNGLEHVKNDIVLVHDGARPFINQHLIDSLKMNAIEYGCAVPGVKVKDTIKIVNDGFIKETISRHLLVAVQTPQACLTSLLKTVHTKAKNEDYLGTDEASLIEKYSEIKVKVVEGNYDNLKITTQEDIIYADKIYNKYFKEDL